MKFKIKENQAGLMRLNDGTKHNYGTIRATQNMSKLIYYTDKGLREIFKPDIAEEVKRKAEELKKLDEKTLMKSGHVSEVLLSEIKEAN